MWAVLCFCERLLFSSSISSWRFVVEESAETKIDTSFPLNASAISLSAGYSMNALLWKMNFGVCAVSNVFASQLSCAAHAELTVPTTKMLKSVNANSEALFFTREMLDETVINLSWVANNPNFAKTKFRFFYDFVVILTQIVIIEKVILIQTAIQKEVFRL